MKTLLSISLLCTLFSPGALLNCHNCMGDDCVAPKVQECAADEDACLEQVIEMTLVSSLMPNYTLTMKRCTSAKSCLQNYVSISTVDDGKYQSNMQCCYTNLCNHKHLSLPEPVRHPPNGVQCPACIAIGSTECDKVETMNCTGGETRCFQETISLRIEFLGENVNIHVEGCATPNVCFLPPPNIISDKIQFNVTQWQCTKDLSEESGEPIDLLSSESTIPRQGARNRGPNQ